LNKELKPVDENKFLFDKDYYKPRLDNKYRKDLSFIVIAAVVPFALTDVWTGYCKALDVMGYRTLPIATHQIKAFFNENVMWRFIHSQIVTKREGFTHAIFIGGRDNSAPWLLESLYGVKSIVISTEDPHGLDQNQNIAKLYNYYFTNEKNVLKYIKGANYLPTAANHYACMPINKKELPEDLFCDILFLGNVYPNRQKILENIIPLVEKKNYKYHIAGITAFADEETPIRKYVKIYKGYELVDHQLSICLYNAAKIIININRDPFWESNPRSTNREHKCEGYSMNPRFYEVGLSGGFQLVDNTRKEVYKMFKCDCGPESEVITFDLNSPTDLSDKIDYYLQHEDERLNIAYNFHQKVIDNHTYLNRTQRLINFIKLKENPQEGIQSLIKTAGEKKK